MYIFKVHPGTGHEDADGEYRYSSTLPLTATLNGAGWSTPLPDRFTPGKGFRHPLYRRLGGHQGSVWTAAENLAHTWIRSPDRPACSESLCNYTIPAHPTYISTYIRGSYRKS